MGGRGYALAPHNDDMHVGSAKRGAANGVAGLDANTQLEIDSFKRGLLGNPLLYPKVVSNNHRHSHTGTVVITSTSAVEHKRITFSDGLAGTVRVKFSLVGGINEDESPITSYGRVYVNGSPVGSWHSTTSPTNVAFSEDVNVGELQVGNYIQIFCYRSASDNPAEYGGVLLMYIDYDNTSDPIAVASSNS